MNGENRAETIHLLADARDGNSKALAELIAMYEPLTESLLKKYFRSDIPFDDLDDIRQEMLIIFCNAVMTYNLNQQDVEFGLYAKICMERSLVSLLRAMKKRLVIEQMPENEALQDTGNDPSRQVAESESIAELWKLIKENLSDYENKVWNLHLSGHSPAATADMLGRDVKSIDNALCRIRVKLRKALKRQHR